MKVTYNKNLGYAVALIVILYIIYSFNKRIGFALTFAATVGVLGYQARNKSGIFAAKL
jgi:hypothetical protein